MDVVWCWDPWGRNLSAASCPQSGGASPSLGIKPCVICCLLKTSTHTYKQTNKCFNSWWLKWHVSGPDCADSFTGSCQHNEPSEASNEAIIACGTNNQSTVSSVVRISQSSRADNRLAAVLSRGTWSFIGEVYVTWEPGPSPNTHKGKSSCKKTLTTHQSVLLIKTFWNHQENCSLFGKLWLTKTFLTWWDLPH